MKSTWQGNRSISRARFFPWSCCLCKWQCLIVQGLLSDKYMRWETSWDREGSPRPHLFEMLVKNHKCRHIVERNSPNSNSVRTLTLSQWSVLSTGHVVSKGKCWHVLECPSRIEGETTLEKNMPERTFCRNWNSWVYHHMTHGSSRLLLK